MSSDYDMQSCIDTCVQCHQTCLETAMKHCLETGGKHVEAGHFRLMMNCAEICQVSANVMLSGSDFSGRVCSVCAEICEACADSCEQVGGMDECVETCRDCAQTCREMSGGAS
ncbi:MAG: four-helix bundle copper-binding protein [Nitrosospira sp.]|nr:four-helix bundle copper-binding protein [Nitrosospira sp.]MDN5882589.1 four-helix bundle copper-binding protein [Nitrosospira sp.]MDN5935120.1 four-helix bundle copper-binding protein [Nitrosospira sp.]